MEVYRSDAHRQCPINCAEKDRARKKFFKDLYHFPNLFSLSAWFHDTDRVHALLRRTEEELQDGRLQHPLEEVRSHNLIVFLQYRLGCKQKALEYCRGLQEDTSMNKSIIFLTLLAMLQYELKPPRVHKKTLATLQDLCHASDFEYLQAVAESEKGNALISIGPMGFVNAMDCFQRAIDTCPDILLWKYDLALAIRRHFNPYAFSKHPKHPAPVLAQKAVELLRNTAAECTDSFYEVRSIVELARLVSHLQLFCTVCSEDEKVTISKLIEEYDEQHLYEEAFKKDCSKDDFYTIRECGRHFLSVKSFDKAVQCFQASYSKRKTSMVCQLFGKAYLNMYKSSCNPPALPSPADFEERSESRCRATLPSTSPEPTAELLQDLKTSMSGARQRPMEQGAIVVNETDSLAVDSGYTPQNGSGEPTMPESHLPTSGGCAPPDRIQSVEERKLLDEFDKDLHINPEGGFKATPPYGIDSVYPQQQRHLYKKSNSYPPSADTGKKKSHRSGHGRSRAKVKVNVVSEAKGRAKVKGNIVFGAKHRVYRYDASDQRVQMAEDWFLKGLRINPSNIALRYDTGVLYEGMHELDKALEQYQDIIGCKVHKGRVSAIDLVNAYERSGLCLMELSEQCQDSKDKEALKEDAEDMFMCSLLECRQAVALLPQISRQRASLWQSYPALLKLLHQPEQADSRHLQKVAEVHEAVGQHLEAVKVYQEAMELARCDEDRTSALRGRVSNYLGMNDTKEAKFILDLFLTCEEECHMILTAQDEVTAGLRDVAIEVYYRAGKEALSRGDKGAAQAAFRWALLMSNKLPPPSRQLPMLEPPTAAGEEVDSALVEKVDVAIFYDYSCPTNCERLSAMAAALATACKDAFGMRVSVNDEKVKPGHASYTGETLLAESAPLVILVVAAGVSLSRRMKGIADIAIESNKDCMLVCLEAAQSPTATDSLPPVASSVGEFPCHTITTKDGNLHDFISVDDCSQSLRAILRVLRQLRHAAELLVLNDSDVTENQDAVCRFFDFLIVDSQS